MQIVEL